jgi:hypothetical protein
MRTAKLKHMEKIFSTLQRPYKIKKTQVCYTYSNGDVPLKCQNKFTLQMVWKALQTVNFHSPLERAEDTRDQTNSVRMSCEVRINQELMGMQTQWPCGCLRSTWGHRGGNRWGIQRWSGWNPSRQTRRG